MTSLFLLSFVTVLAVSRLDQRYNADAIVVLGAAQYNGRPSPVLQARLDHGAELFHEGWAEQIVVTGGIVAGDRMSEATAGQRYLVSIGIPPDAVWYRRRDAILPARWMPLPHGCWAKDVIA